MSDYRTPGVYTEEISTLPPSVVPVETAIPAFIGYTQKRPFTEIKAVRISSITEYHALFGGPAPEKFPGISVSKAAGADFFSVDTPPPAPSKPSFWLYYQLQLFYANGGGPCYIISVGDYSETISKDKLIKGLDALS
ncbi:MAG: phage tail sheath family protein, partial [Sinomicrobium sp.]|nr:phage tail sheath family protein [Sinomicrobium sp.]